MHDNEALQHAHQLADKVLHVYVFDPRVFGGKTKFGFAKTGVFRTQFYIDAVADLRERLVMAGSDLIVRVGEPEEVIYELAKEVKASWVYCNRERTEEEVMVQDSLEKRLWTIGLEMVFTRGKMLFYTQDLPFPITHTPDSFTNFRKEVERIVPVREPLAVPERLRGQPDQAPARGELPRLGIFHEKKEGQTIETRFGGGETAGLKRLNYYLWEADLVAGYKETRNNLLGDDYSSKFSPYLAAGCLSPKMIYWEVKRYESEKGENESTYWLVFELLWRDFFRLMGKKYQNRIFQKGGPIQLATESLIEDWDLFAPWAKGETGVPFIDANMRELNSTGYMSNRGRQNVASFLVKDLGLNWQMGASYFESLLIDYDPCSNWGNWNYIAGVGSDVRLDRYFNILSQAKKYDPDGRYVKYWVPELKFVPMEYVHTPDQMTEAQRIDSGIVMEGDYPEPIVSTLRWS